MKNQISFISRNVTIMVWSYITSRTNKDNCDWRLYMNMPTNLIIKPQTHHGSDNTHHHPTIPQISKPQKKKKTLLEKPSEEQLIWDNSSNTPLISSHLMCCWGGKSQNHGFCQLAKNISKLYFFHLHSFSLSLCHLGGPPTPHPPPPLSLSLVICTSSPYICYILVRCSYNIFF